MAMDGLSSHSQTVPTTVGALLTEECTIDPLSHLPSFLELTFVDVARNSGRRALSAAWGVGVVWLQGTIERLRRLERRLTDRVESRAVGGEASSSVVQLIRFIRTLALHLSRLRVKILRRMCGIFLGTVKTLAPELQAMIMFAIDYNCMHYLAGATACEMVYGLKRSKIVKARNRQPPLSKLAQSLQPTANDSRADLQQSNQQAGGQSAVTDLTSADKTLSALFAALLPYCKERFDRCYAQWNEQTTNSSLNHTPRSTRVSRNRDVIDDHRSKFVVQLYPYFHMVHEGSIFAYQFAYLLGFTPYWSFSMHSLGVMLRRMTVADVQEQEKQKQMQQRQQMERQQQGRTRSHIQSDDATTSTRSQPRQQTGLTAPGLLKGAVLFSVSYTLLSGWYSHFQRELRLRRRRWIAGNDDGTAADIREGDLNEEGLQRRSKLPIPPPPLPPKVDDENDGTDDKWSCPICKEPRINPTASTSGYVYCYKCLVSHLRNEGEYCPVTGMTCYENKVVRLFEPTASRASRS